jgi:hypothetical protein
MHASRLNGDARCYHMADATPYGYREAASLVYKSGNPDARYQVRETLTTTTLSAQPAVLTPQRTGSGTPARRWLLYPIHKVWFIKVIGSN